MHVWCVRKTAKGYVDDDDAEQCRVFRMMVKQRMRSMTVIKGIEKKGCV